MSNVTFNDEKLPLLFFTIYVFLRVAAQHVTQTSKQSIHLSIIIFSIFKMKCLSIHYKFVLITFATYSLFKYCLCKNLKYPIIFLNVLFFRSLLIRYTIRFIF